MSDAFTPGGDWPDHTFFNNLLGEAKRNRIGSVGRGLELRGSSLSRVNNPRIWAQLSGSGPAYGFAEATPNTSSGFDLLTNGRTDSAGAQPAYEANAVSGLAGTYQRLRFEPSSGDWRFRDLLTASSGVPVTLPVVPLPNCFCTETPATLTMTSLDPTCNYRMFQSCTLQYGPTPAAYAPLGLPANIFLSVESFPDPIFNNALFRYYFTCFYNVFSLSRLYVESPYGSPYRDGVLYSWILGGYGNSCTPFHLDGGVAFPGSDMSCDVKIDG